MRSKLRDSICIPGLEEEIAKIIESTPEPGMEQAMAELTQVLKHCNREVTDCIPKEFYVLCPVKITIKFDNNY